MDAPITETSKDTKTIALSRVASPSTSRFDRQIIVIVTPKRDFCIHCEESEVVSPVQESGKPASMALVI